MNYLYKFPVFVLLLSTASLFSQSGLVAYYDFDDLENNKFTDASQYSNHGTSYGAKLIPGIKNNALSFDGIDDYTRIPGDGQAPPEIFSGLGEGSISVWFKVDHIPTEYGIAPIFYYGSEEKCDFFDAANQGLIIEIGHSPIHYGSERIYFTIWKNGCTLPSFCYDSKYAVPVGEWQHYVAVVGENYNTGYLNGKEMTDRRYNFGNSNYSQFFEDAVVHEKLWLGKGHWDRTNQYFDGAIDELRIYDRALSASEIMNLYSDTVNTNVQEQIQGKTEINIYPNPVNNKLYYDLNGLQNDMSSINIMNINGKTILRKDIFGSKNSVDVTALPDGLYFINFIGQRTSIYKTFILIQ